MKGSMQSSKSTIGYKAAPLTELPLGQIQPEGWLRDQLKIQAEGFTGQLDTFWEDVGPNNGWLGGTGDDWERGPYYLDGLLPLAYVLQDEALIKKTTPWIEWTLSSQQDNGQFGPTSNTDWWPRMVMLKVLIQYAEATQDDRVVPFMTKYFRYQLNTIQAQPLRDWAVARGGENILCIQWLYERTQDASLLQLIDILHQQTIDWTGIFNKFPYWRYQTSYTHRVHVVNIAMGLKEPMLYAMHTGDKEHREAPLSGIRALMTHHGQAHGMFSGDEWLAGTHPSQGVELCAVVEYMFTLEHLVRLSGEGVYGDILEKVAFNALPATIGSDWRSHQYDQQVNQVMCTLAKRPWTQNGDDANLFGLEPHFGCCTANMHQGWPKLAARLWMGTRDGGLAAVSYAPCTVQTTVANSVNAKLTVDTDYPFNDRISIQVNLANSAAFPIKLRIPEWCHDPSIVINGSNQPISLNDGFTTIERTWQNGDVIQLTLPMEPVVEPRANDAVSVSRGPLVYALPVQERWQKLRGEEPYADWEIYPESAWNYGLCLDSENPAQGLVAEQKDIARQPFSPESAPVVLKATGRRVPSWRLENNSAGDLPHSPAHTSMPKEDLTLIPYACARLRIAEFPRVE
ncbi:beta-L-arabinofuranosidase domain-containing protein [Aureibacillus halotolerans]|uniref:Beta-L-arabinofuranosidase (Glycosyl hydrolase family 127) n=1 Tax=Aureibacillus halotolerans TaxID=1508390 RepID=A0A4R6U5B0_9BACI|nr:beta-L-arabinofuranosidase domain-containing protein [Aureibacillus halotolerans]TDQ40722.1 beta-L-arabinofuranosidase (glycosyl hydrolase family 127) [Aureibacillus halotolerans]